METSGLEKVKRKKKFNNGSGGGPCPIIGEGEVLGKKSRRPGGTCQKGRVKKLGHPLSLKKRNFRERKSLATPIYRWRGKQLKLRREGGVCVGSKVFRKVDD